MSWSFGPADPFAPSNGGDLGLGSDLSIYDIGPQPDGTYSAPSPALPVNNPANVAGNPSVTSLSGLDVLRAGTGILSQVAQWDLSRQFLDYKRYEATNGGLYRQGVPAGYIRTANGQITASTPWTLILLAVAAVFIIKKTT